MKGKSGKTKKKRKRKAIHKEKTTKIQNKLFILFQIQKFSSPGSRARKGTHDAAGHLETKQLPLR